LKNKENKPHKIFLVIIAFLLIFAVFPVTQSIKTANANDNTAGETKEIEDATVPAAAAQNTPAAYIASSGGTAAPQASASGGQQTAPQEEPPVQEEPPKPLEMDAEACIKWLAEQAATTGTEANLYFAGASEGALFDSEDPAAAAQTNADFLTAGLANAANTYGWRIVKRADGSLDIYFTLEALDEDGKALDTFKYNTAEGMIRQGASRVGIRTAGVASFFVIDSGAYKTAYTLDLTNPEYMAGLLYNAGTEFWQTESLLGVETGRPLMNRCASFFSNGTFVDCPGGTATRASGTIAGYHIGNDFFAFLGCSPFSNFKVYLSDKDANGGRVTVIGAEYKYGSDYFLYDPDGLVALRLAL
jgi:hypothetical protein